MTDARFEDGEEAPLHLIAQDVRDLEVVSMLLQDAVFAQADMAYDRRRRRFAILLNRFRWEDRPSADAAGRGYERVRALLVAEDVQAVRTAGLDRTQPDAVLSLLGLRFVPGTQGMGEVILTLSGQGAVALTVETLDLRLDDVTRPYLAPSRRAPEHKI